MAGQNERSRSSSTGTKKVSLVRRRSRSSSYPDQLQAEMNSITEIKMNLGKSSESYMMNTSVGKFVSPPNNETKTPNVPGVTDIKRKGTKFRKMYLAALASLLSAVAMGMALGYSSPATYDMQKRESSRIRVNDDEITWIGSMVALGALTGGIFAGPLADKLGRRDLLIYNSVPFLTGWLLIIYAQTVLVILLGRYITGLACGLVSVTVPMYAVEISTPEVRGLLGASYQGLLVVGSLISMSLGAYVPWTWLAVASALMVFAGLVCLCPMPESPRWLIAHGMWDEAIKAVQYLQGDHLDAKTECDAIMEDLKLQPKGKLTHRDFLIPIVYKPMLLSTAQMFFQQFSGANVVLYYTSSIFESAGSTLNPKISSIIVSAIQVVATLVSTALMDKAGRRILLLLSGFFMAVSMTTLGTFLFMSHKDETIGKTMAWIPLVSLVVFITAFSFGYGSIPWLMVAEMVPVRTRSIVSGLATISNGLFAFTVTKTFKMLEEKIDTYGVYWSYGIVSFIGCVFMWFFLPETKGKRLEDIQKVFTGEHREKTDEPRSISTITLREVV